MLSQPRQDNSQMLCMICLILRVKQDIIDSVRLHGRVGRLLAVYTLLSSFACSLGHKRYGTRSVRVNGQKRSYTDCTGDTVRSWHGSTRRVKRVGGRLGDWRHFGCRTKILDLISRASAQSIVTTIKANLLGFGLSIPKTFHSRRNFQIPCTAAHTPSAVAAAPVAPTAVAAAPAAAPVAAFQVFLHPILHPGWAPLCLCCLLQVELVCISGTNKLSAPCTLFDLCSSMYILRSAY